MPGQISADLEIGIAGKPSVQDGIRIIVDQHGVAGRSSPCNRECTLEMEMTISIKLLRIGIDEIRRDIVVLVRGNSIEGDHL